MQSTQTLALEEDLAVADELDDSAFDRKAFERYSAQIRADAEAAKNGTLEVYSAEEFHARRQVFWQKMKEKHAGLAL